MTDLVKGMLIKQVSKELKNGLVDEYIAKEKARFAKEQGISDVDFMISEEFDGTKKRIYLSYVHINGFTVCKIYKQMPLADFLCKILEG